MKYLNWNYQWQQLIPQNWQLGRLIVAVCLLITLSSCQNFSPKDPQVSSTTSTTPNLDALELTAQNWQTIEGEGVSLSLPEHYRGGNPTRDLTEIESQLSELQKGYGQRLQTIKQNLEHTVLIAFDARSLTKDALTNVNIVQHPLEETVNLETYLSQAVNQLQPTHQIEEQTIMTQNGSSQGRIVAKITTEQDITMTQLFYFQPKPETMWITTYTTPANEFNQRSGNFEESIASLQFQT